MFQREVLCTSLLSFETLQSPARHPEKPRKSARPVVCIPMCVIIFVPVGSFCLSLDFASGNSLTNFVCTASCVYDSTINTWTTFHTATNWKDRKNASNCQIQTQKLHRDTTDSQAGLQGKASIHADVPLVEQRPVLTGQSCQDSSSLWRRCIQRQTSFRCERTAVCNMKQFQQLLMV